MQYPPPPRALRLMWTLAACAGAVLVVLGGIVLWSGSQPLGMAEWVQDRAVDLANDGVIRMAGWITHLGDSFVAWFIAGLVTVTLVAFRRFPHALTVGGGMALAVVLVRVGKAVVERARPLDAVAHGSGTSFPSGHSTYGVMYLVLGIVATLVIPQLAGRRWPVVLGGAITLLIPLTRVYLRPHWVTDVIGGLSAGVAAFSLAGTLALWLVMRARKAG